MTRGILCDEDESDVVGGTIRSEMSTRFLGHSMADTCRVVSLDIGILLEVLRV